ncbi:KAP family P-loop NTPase fold protein [Minwuia thermotolerans]|nr:P-loop NTPase fold protein [Minwuia thermotolerans]
MTEPSGEQAEIQEWTMNSDRPIAEPDEDQFELTSFARTIARVIAKNRSEDSFVLGVHGPWGIGKSSTVALVRHCLDAEFGEDRENLEIIEFNPWWFTDKESLHADFFAELAAAMSLPDRERARLRAIGHRLGKHSASIAPIVGLIGGSAMEKALRATGGVLQDFLEDPKATVPHEHRRISDALREAGKRYLVVIDDLDRLDIEEAMMVFQLVKSSGRLPNITYMLVFDRALVERHLKERFSGADQQYLDKIIQASFEVPPPDKTDLRYKLREQVLRAVDAQNQDDEARILDVLVDVVWPFLNTARDLARFDNVLKILWPSVEGELDRADFVGIEALRVFLPLLHRRIFDNKNAVLRRPAARGLSEDDRASMTKTLFDGLDQPSVRVLQQALSRLFPRLEIYWGGSGYDSDWEAEWRKNRQICSETFFDSYFRYAIDDSTLPASQLDQIISQSGDGKTVASALRKASARPRRQGGTKAASLLDELVVRAEDVPEQNIESFLGAVFSVVDEINLPIDGSRRLGDFEDNELRAHWLLNRFRDRVSKEQFDRAVVRAAKLASLQFLLSLADRALRNNGLIEGRRGAERSIVSSEAAIELRDLALEAVTRAASDMSLLQVPELVSSLYVWMQLEEMMGEETVRDWVQQNLEDPQLVVALAGSFVSTNQSSSGRSNVTRTRYLVHKKLVAGLCDPKRLISCVDELLAGPGTTDEEKSTLRHFRELWDEASDEEPLFVEQLALDEADMTEE